MACLESPFLLELGVIATGLGLLTVMRQAAPPDAKVNAGGWRYLLVGLAVGAASFDFAVDSCSLLSVRKGEK